jgi:hypothetical protein
MIRERVSSDINRRLKSFLNVPSTTKKETDEIVHPYLGCSIKQFKEYLESLFTEGMAWDKYGYFYTETDGQKKLGFHIDHIIPCSAFDLTNAKDFFLCFHWKNCQPLWGDENMGKRNAYTENEKRLYMLSMESLEGYASKEKEILSLIEKVTTQIASHLPQLVASKSYKDDDYRKQRLLYQDYVFDQALQDAQVMFFMAENPPDESKAYQETLYFRMKNKQSRKVGEDNARSKKVCQLSLDGTLLNTYASMNMGAKENGTFHSIVSKCCSNPDKFFKGGGFYWCFLHHLEDFQRHFVDTLSVKQKN